MKLPILLTRLLSLTKNNTMDNSTLVLTQILFRHGHRSPDQSFNYPNDPYKNENYMPYGKGELTMIGRKQCYNLGKKLRERYNDFLGPEYYHGIIDAKSSELSRARTTLQLVLAGLFPPSGNEKIDDFLNWHPVPYTYVSIKEDPLIGKAIVNMYNHEDHPNFGKSKNCQEVIKCIEDKLNWPVKKQAQCFLIYDVIKAQIGLGLEKPEWCRDIYPEKIAIVTKQLLEHNFSRKSFLENGYGGLINEFNDVMWKKVKEIQNNSSDKVPKMFLYSGHDLNIFGVLCCFGYLDATKWPQYTSNLILELHQIDDKFYVKMLYQDGCDNKEYTEQPRTVIKLPNCDNDLCPLTKFTEYVKEFFQNNPSSL